MVGVRSVQGRADLVARAGFSYAKNDRLDFEILYEWEGATHKYIPDFLVRLKIDGAPDVTVVLEVKGQEREQDRAKYAAAEKWVRAVNHHGGFGTWAFMVCRDPNRLGEVLDGFRLRCGGVNGSQVGLEQERTKASAKPIWSGAISPPT